MELVSFEAPTLRSRTLPLQETLIMPVGDVQYGASSCDVKRFKKHIEWGAKRKNVLFLGMGDMVDFGSPSNRTALKSLLAGKKLYDTTENVLDNAAQQHLEQLQEILAPTKGMWLGLLQGHHFWPYADGTTSDTRLAQYLGAPFLGTCAIVEVKFASDQSRKNKKKSPSFKIWAHHGQGSGSTQTAPVTKLEKLAGSFDDVDVFLMAHYHRKAAAKMQRIRPIFTPSGRGYLEDRNIILSGTGGFLKGYMEGHKNPAGNPEGTYIEQGVLSPVALGGVVIWARPRFNRYGTPSVDLDISI